MISNLDKKQREIEFAKFPGNRTISRIYHVRIARIAGLTPFPSEPDLGNKATTPYFISAILYVVQIIFSASIALLL